ncbi:MAG TPA: acyltransferase [Actinomycetota bacterium]|nr:acyltransferase [Actinomycetota bacterium]
MTDDVFVHPLGLCESEDVGSGTRIWAFAHVMAGATVGVDCNVCDHAFVESGAVVGNRVTVKNAVLVWDKVVIEDDVFLGPGCIFTNDLDPRAALKKTPDRFLPTTVRHGATIGANATIVCGIAIGSHAMVGAGAVVTNDVPNHALVAGSPARRIAWICECGLRLPDALICACGRSYKLLNEKEGLEQTS